MRVPWTARGSNQSVLKEINPKYSLEGLMLKLKFQYFGQLIGQAHDAGKIEGRRRRVLQDERAGWHHQFNGYELGQNPEGKGQGSLACPLDHRVRHGLVTEQQHGHIIPLVLFSDFLI